MRSPLFFFIIVFVIDLVLKSAKNKKKVEQARRKRTDEINPIQPKNKSIMQTIKDEIEKEVQKDSKKRMVKQPIYKEESTIAHKNSVEMIKNDEMKNRSKWSEDIFEKPITESLKNGENKKDSLQKDILKGIIFSEIISEPKSIKNHRKSM
jgi:hypothetical protein